MNIFAQREKRGESGDNDKRNYPQAVETKLFSKSAHKAFITNPIILPTKSQNEAGINLNNQRLHNPHREIIFVQMKISTDAFGFTDAAPRF